MRIFFDGQVFNSRAYGGGGRFFFELIRELTIIPGCEVELFAGAYRTPLPIGVLWRKCRPFYGVRTPALGPLRQWLEGATHSLGRWCLDHGNIDVYHPTYYQTFVPRKKIPQVVTIFDLNHERYPQQFPGGLVAANRKRALSEATAVVCISEATGRQALEIYPEISGKMSVIPLASSLQPVAGDNAKPSGGHPYFLYVGNRSGYKNFRAMVEACRAFPDFARHYRLVCYGGQGFTEAEQRLLTDHDLQKCVEHQSGDDQLLATLYRDAICFIYPSLEEGFGIPLLEAMNCRCPVLASRIPVFEEVAGEAASYFDPTSPEELVARMREMTDDSGRREALVRAGTLRAPLFSWKHCAHRHFELYTAIAAGRAAGLTH